MRLNEILAQNLHRLMQERPNLDTQMKVRQATQVIDPVTGEVEVAGLTQSTVQRVLHAKVHVTLDTLQRLADAFEVSPTSLLTDGAPTAPAPVYSAFAAQIANLFDSLPKDQHTQAKAFMACHAALSDVARQPAPQTRAPNPSVKSRTARG